MNPPKKIGILLALCVGLAGCIHPKIKYHKGKILSPLMDPAKTDASLANGLMLEPASWYEKTALEMTGSQGNSCPTCGK